MVIPDYLESMLAGNRHIQKSPPTLANPSVLVILAVALALAGSMLTDPLAGLSCLVAALIPAALAVVYGKGGKRVAAVIILVAVALLAFSKFPGAVSHFHSYKDRGRQPSTGIPEKAQ